MFKKRKIPHTYVIVFFIIIFSAALTWIVPGGAFQRESKLVNGVEREIIVNNSFEYTESFPQTWQVFSAMFNGFVNTSHIIIFILMIGGAFWIMNESKAIDVGIFSFLKFTKKLESIRFFRFFGVDNIIITLIMIMFSIFGAVFGMSEETIAFIIIFVPLSISMGYDSIVGVSMCFVAAGLGFAGALLNPFTIGIAQGLADIPLFSGIEYRMFMWLIINTVGIAYILRYAKKVKATPKSSVVYEDDNYWRKKGNSDIESMKYHTPLSAWIVYLIIIVVLIVYAFLFPQTEMKMGNATTILPVIPVLAVVYGIMGFLSLLKSVHFYILNLLLFTIMFLIVGVMGYDWYVMKIATIFLAMGIFSGIAMKYSPNKIVNLFLTGTKDILSAAVIVGLAGGIIVVLQDGNIIDTLLYYLSKSMSDFGRIASVSMMYFFQTILNIVIPSGSGKAALTMPMMSQFSDLIGVSRQATVVAFQLGDGFTNMITPTSGVLIGVLGVARIPFEKWVKWIFPFMVILVILGLILLIPTVTMDLNGF
jgi:uncharacterized ion transporter superfamily protein YfcC